MSIKRFVVDVSGTAAYPVAGSPQVEVPFDPKTLTMAIISGTAGVELSFDGITTDIELTPGTPLQGYVAQQGSAMRKVYLRRKSASSGIVHLIAES